MSNDNHNANNLLAHLRHELHVWTAAPADFAGSAVATDYHSILSDGEKTQYLRFHFDKDRYHYLIAHLLVRYVLSQYVSIRPEAWCFSKGAKGKPAIDPACCTLPLQFNLTHTDGLVACAVSWENAVGLDAENIGRVKDPMQLATKIFTQEERVLLGQLTGAAQDEYFCALWVLKEAYVKAIGAGIGFGVEKLHFQLAPHQCPKVQFIPSSLDQPTNWQFGLYRFTEQHQMAIAWQKGQQSAREIVFKEGFKNWV